LAMPQIPFTRRPDLQFALPDDLGELCLRQRAQFRFARAGVLDLGRVDIGDAPFVGCEPNDVARNHLDLNRLRQPAVREREQNCSGNDKNRARHDLKSPEYRSKWSRRFMTLNAHTLQPSPPPSAPAVIPYSPVIPPGSWASLLMQRSPPYCLGATPASVPVVVRL